MRSFTDSDGAVWRYDPAEVIDSGGAGVVYQGAGADGTAVAVKRVELGLGSDLAARIHGRAPTELRRSCRLKLVRSKWAACGKGFWGIVAAHSEQLAAAD